METYQIINLADWQQVGEGGNGKTYVNPAAPGEILKVNTDRIKNNMVCDNNSSLICSQA